MKYTLGFPVGAMGEPGPCRDLHPRKSRYIDRHQNSDWVRQFAVRHLEH